MTVKDLIENRRYEVINEGTRGNMTITTPYCCDLLSIAMGRAPAGCAWVTVMANMNTLAVAALTDTACIILAEGVQLDEAAKDKAREKGITVLADPRPVYVIAKEIDELSS